MMNEKVAVDGRAGLTDGGVGIGPRVDGGKIGLIDGGGEQGRGQIVAGRLHALLPPHLLGLRCGDGQAALSDQMVDEGEMPDFVRRLERGDDHTVGGGEEDE